GRDCWWGRCTFCSWAALFPGNHYQVVSPLKAIEEIQLLQHLGVKEVFDDSGTFPVGEWLEQFCRLMIKSGLNKKIQLGANMRFGALSQTEFNLMKKAGFRFLLFGLESANQTTLNKINKNIKVDNVIPTLTMAQKAGISSHITIMVGYPWENKKDLNKTLAFCRSIFRQGLVASMQATIIVPYPGTPLFNYCRKNNLLTTSNWNKYDMGQPVIKTKVSADYLKQSVRDLFKGIITPRFIFNQITSLKSWADFQHLLFYTIKYFQKLNDFR
ncbi:MAG TPA: radical SAM protein, partial [Candidatus Woesebacteria bacterium]|nr:radical SAM protein [Candidatus Woesebacteria bacterium]